MRNQPFPWELCSCEGQSFCRTGGDPTSHIPRGGHMITVKNGPVSCCTTFKNGCLWVQNPPLGAKTNKLDAERISALF